MGGQNGRGHHKCLKMWNQGVQSPEPRSSPSRASGTLVFVCVARGHGDPKRDGLRDCSQPHADLALAPAWRGNAGHRVPSRLTEAPAVLIPAMPPEAHSCQLPPAIHAVFIGSKFKILSKAHTHTGFKESCKCYQLRSEGMILEIKFEFGRGKKMKLLSRDLVSQT